MGKDSTVLLAILVVVAIIVVVLARKNEEDHGSKSAFTNWGSHWGPNLAYGYPYNYSLATADPGTAEVNRMYSSAEVDPLITGQLYAGVRAAGEGRAWVYGGRTSFGDKWGMHEFSSGVPGQAGVDVGLLGMREYSLDGKPDVFDDGIPENWKLPSTPTNWYVPQQRDYYDVESQDAAVYKPDLLPLQEPDHDPLVN
jgi:hypothetical protein